MTFQHCGGNVNCGSGFHRIAVAVLGASGVGKSSIVQQFMWNTFDEEYSPTLDKTFHYQSVLINGHLYEVRILDAPQVPYFPPDSLCEWADFRGYGLRSAAAYVLVFDITNLESFRYLKSLYEQISESRDTQDVPVLIVGNKHDLKDERNLTRREIAHIVKKQWKSGYVECCAKCNWHVVLVFEEVMRAVEQVTDWAGGGWGHKSASHRVHHRLHHALTTRSSHCTIL